MKVETTHKFTINDIDVECSDYELRALYAELHLKFGDNEKQKHSDPYTIPPIWKPIGPSYTVTSNGAISGTISK